MRVIRHHLDVQAPLAVVEANWPHFVQWVLTGHEKLACDEFVCVDAVGGGHISFAPQAKKTTRVVFELTEQDGDLEGLPLAEIDRRITHDLLVFKDYVERGGMTAKHPTRSEREALLTNPETREKRRRDSMSDSGDGTTSFWRP
jgi:hypothetical protein